MPLEIAASTLSLGTPGDDVARVHQALQALGRRVRLGDMVARLLGT
jgi:hypothetical protein